MSRAFPKTTLETSFNSFWCQEVNGRRLFKEMTESTLAFSAEQKNYREITALGGMFREHRAPIHSLMLQWPQYDSLLPKVVPTSCLPRRICDPQSHTPSPHPHNHPHCVSKWRFPPTCLYPQLSIIGFQLAVSGEHPPPPPILPPSPHTSPRLHGITSIWPTFRPRFISSCTLSICFFLQQFQTFLFLVLCFCHLNPDVIQFSFSCHFIVFLFKLSLGFF